MTEFGSVHTGIRINYDNNAFIKLLKIDRIGSVEKYAMWAYSIHAIHGYNNLKTYFLPYRTQNLYHCPCILLAVVAECFAAFTLDIDISFLERIVFQIHREIHKTACPVVTSQGHRPMAGHLSGYVRNS